MTGRREDGKASSYEKEGGCQGEKKRNILGSTGTGVTLNPVNRNQCGQ